MIYWIIGGVAFICGFAFSSACRCHGREKPRVGSGQYLGDGRFIGTPQEYEQMLMERKEIEKMIDDKVKTLENQASRGIFDSIKVIIEKSGVRIRPGYSGSTSTESGDHCTMKVAELLETILESYEKVSVKPASGFELKLKVKK